MNPLSKMMFQVLSASALIALAACDSPKDLAEQFALPPSKFALEKISAEPLKGRIQQTEWNVQTAIATVTREGDLQVVISGNGETMNCQYPMFMRVGIVFVVPNQVGTYNFDMLKPEVGNPVTVIFPESASSPEGFQAVADQSQIAIDSIGDRRVTGGLSAKVMDPSYTSNINGRFEAILCQ